MPFNGSGTYSPPGADYPAVSNTLITAAHRNNIDADIASALSNCVTRDGQSPATANIPLGGYKITGLGYGTSSTDAARIDNCNALSTCEFRLTLTTATPVTTSDVTGATTLYWTPYKGNRIALYDGSANWYMRTSSELSIAVPNASNKVYDVFIYDNAGTPAIELLVWTDLTNRATSLTLQNGVLVKSGATTRRYVGSMATTNVAGQTVDSLAARYVWNYYNRVRRPMRVLEATDNWTYTTATIRQANSSGANALYFLNGYNEDMVSAEIMAFASNLTNAATCNVIVGVGLDSTSTFTSGGLFGNELLISNGAIRRLGAEWKGFSGVGVHYLSWNELSNATGTTTWYGDNSTPTTLQAGIHGEIWS